MWLFLIKTPNLCVRLRRLGSPSTNCISTSYFSAVFQNALSRFAAPGNTQLPMRKSPFSVWRPLSWTTANQTSPLWTLRPRRLLEQEILPGLLFFEARCPCKSENNSSTFSPFIAANLTFASALQQTLSFSGKVPLSKTFFIMTAFCWAQKIPFRKKLCVKCIVYSLRSSKGLPPRSSSSVLRQPGMSSLHETSIHITKLVRASARYLSFCLAV
jgi:hypothetical protein